jgi:adenosylcobinamide-phosphate synthase
MWLDPFYCASVITVALLLDILIGEIPRFHPLVGLGNYIAKVKHSLWYPSRIRGVIAVVLVLLPMIPFLWLPSLWWLEVLIVYFAVGGRSLAEHGNAVGSALAQNDLTLAKHKVSMIVSRKTDNMSEQQVVNATLESVLENGNDAVFGALFWFCVAGVPGILLYRFSNTLDAMWGYKNSTFLHFGWAAAKLDDVLNYIPARLCAVAYALGGNAKLAFHCWRTQASKCASPNGGVVMATGAGSLNISLGGAAEYDGYHCDKPILGDGRNAIASDIARAVNLVWLSAVLLIVVLLILGLCQRLL